jgi:hypothetical protein
MKANYTIEAGDVRVIRPLVYVRESTTRDFSQQARLPIINENCPACFEQPKERDRVKKLLAQEEAMVPALFFNLRRALVPLLADEAYEAMAAVAAAAEARGRNPMHRPPQAKKPREGVAPGSGSSSSSSSGPDAGPHHLFGASSSSLSLLVGGKKVGAGGGEGGGSNGWDGDADDAEDDKPAAKKAKHGDADADGTVACTDSYCAPCYELA